MQSPAQDHFVGVGKLIPPVQWQQIAELGNLVEYEGHINEDETLLEKVIAAARLIQSSLARIDGMKPAQ